MPTVRSCTCTVGPGQNGRSRGLVCSSDDRYKNDRMVKPRKRDCIGSYEEISMPQALLTYMGWLILVAIAYIKAFAENPLFSRFFPSRQPEKNREGYPPLFDSFESYYTRFMYRPISDVFNRPISSVPGAELQVLERETLDKGKSFRLTGSSRKCLNMGSYNYLGFAENDGPCAQAAQKTTYELGVGVCSSRQQLGTMSIHQELEKYVARFVGAEDAITFGMGFATNALNLPSIVSKGCLVISDEKNHASLILGLRLSGASVRIFKHNNMQHLEKQLREGVTQGRPRTHRPWKKILIVVEGVYSMEGTIANLPSIIALKKKYKAYLYLDEAHSIGAMGSRGRGVVDYFGCDPRDVDILMGTFTKSFGSAGGYIAGSRKLINHLRIHSHAACYATSMSPPVAQQIISSMRIIMGEDGTNEGEKRLKQLAKNSRYFRQRLRQLGLIVYGNNDSPVVPVMLYMPAKTVATSRELLERGVASVSVGFPATPITESRSRFCVSASHTKEMLDKAVEAMDEVADLLHLRYSRLPRPTGEVPYADIDETNESSLD